MSKSITHVNYNRKLKLLLVKLTHFLLSIALFYLAWMQFRYHNIFQGSEIAGFRYNFFITIAYAGGETQVEVLIVPTGNVSVQEAPTLYKIIKDQRKSS